MSHDRPRPTKHTFAQTKRLLDDFFKVDEYVGTFEKFDNTMSEEQRLLVMERGDSVAALLYDPFEREVILVEQFRLPTLGKGQGGGWFIELPAGIQQADETVSTCLSREVEEETGYQVSQFVPIATFFPSPGGTTERISLFYAEVRQTLKVTDGGGVVRDKEDIRVVRMPLAEFFAKLRGREFEDAKLIIAGQWLKERRAIMLADSHDASQPVDFTLRMPAIKSWLGREVTPQKTIGYIKGGIEGVQNVDVWLNPLTSDMLLDRYTDRTVSAVIRARGAAKYSDGSIKQDVIGNALRDAMRDRHFVEPGKVIDTTSGELLGTNQVKRIFHVATTRVAYGSAPRVDLDTLDRCLENVLNAIEDRGGYKSVAVPMIGTGEGALLVNQVAPRLLARAIRFFTENPSATLERIYFLPYSDIDGEIVKDAFEAKQKFFVATGEQQGSAAAPLS